MTWWGWLILGLIILGAEVVAVDAQFYLVFIGLSAALVGLSQLVGMSMPEWAQWTCFAALSLISMFTFRKNLYERIRWSAGQLTSTSDWTPGTADASSTAARRGPCETSVRLQ